MIRSFFGEQHGIFAMQIRGLAIFEAGDDIEEDGKHYKSIELSNLAETS